ncbi:hypothetical protein [Polyangium sp. 15x6]|uniref:hypothetical protein n=1 Tax=Polyangium sp. 15x6 TaxID=3042687 RepID=UPI00249B6B54|nr:hypothetical protein [Polyangium sp. 15x6]MDI3288998.1 hypothetical protein [Polyangium sp. 15x6]
MQVSFSAPCTEREAQIIRAVLIVYDTALRASVIGRAGHVDDEAAKSIEEQVMKLARECFPDIRITPLAPASPDGDAQS